MDKHITRHQDLSTEKQALLPADPTCEIELTDADLETIHGGIDVLSGLLGGLLGSPSSGSPSGPSGSGSFPAPSGSGSFPAPYSSGGYPGPYSSGGYPDSSDT